MQQSEFERRRLQVAGNIRALRKQAGISGVELGRVTGMSQSKISKLEGAKLTPSDEDVIKLATALKVDIDTKNDLRRQARGLKLAWQSHKALLAGERSAQQDRWSNVEENSRLVEYLGVGAVTAPLQTAEYARAMLEASRIWWHESDIDKFVVRRIQRQAQLYNQDRAFRFLMTQSALRTVIGSEEILARQLDALCSICRQPNIEIGFVDESRPQKRHFTVAFALFDRQFAIAELPTNDVEIREPEDVEAYAELFDMLWVDAIHDVESFVDAHRRLTSR